MDLPTSEKNNQALKFIEILIGFGILSIIVYAIRMLWSYDTIVVENVSKLSDISSIKGSNFQTVISTFGLGILIAGSALTTGCFIGFIFAIPKSIKNSDTNVIKASNIYVANDNLVEVSDWLTKIIVGVGLTQLTSIPKYLYKMGSYVGDSLGGQRMGEVAAQSLVIYFLICGFLLAYLWTRVYFARMLEQAEQKEIEQLRNIALANDAKDGKNEF